MTTKNTSYIKDYTDLQVYQKAYKVSLEIHHLTHSYPDIERYELCKQMRRASKGICANIAEGFGKQSISTAEFKRYLLIAMGSADEMRVWLKYSLDLKYITTLSYDTLETKYRDIARMLNGLHKRWE